MARPSILRSEFFARGVSVTKCRKTPANKGSASSVLAVYLSTCLATYVFLQFMFHCIHVTAFVKLTYNSRPSTKETIVQINRTDTQLLDISVISSQKQALVNHFENLPKALPKLVLTELWKEFQVKPTSRQICLSLSLSLCTRRGPRPWRWQQSAETFLMLPCCRTYPCVISVPHIILSWFQMIYLLACFYTYL
jgi:hypothetical protein